MLVITNILGIGMAKALRGSPFGYDFSDVSFSSLA